jgi:hypothetical protein
MDFFRKLIFAGGRDRAFDRYLIRFDEQGRALIAASVSSPARAGGVQQVFFSNS